VLPGFLVEGETVEEVYREAPVVAQALLEAYQATGVPLPADLAPVADHLRISVLVPA
jgi:predicted RNase H-like HicB family nuclease